jgi:fumarate reductase flavoprotein subunit
MPRLYAAGEDTGGVHGANRLGGNGVANSTVFGALAGDAMVAQLDRNALPHVDPAALEASEERAFSPLGRPRGDLEGIRRALLDVMWDDVGVLRTAQGLARGRARLEALSREIATIGIPSGERRYNLTWTDRLNLENLLLVSRAICAAATARADSRGAHFREDFPQTGDVARSRYTLVRWQEDAMRIDTDAVAFTRVRPGESLLAKPAAE